MPLKLRSFTSTGDCSATDKAFLAEITTLWAQWIGSHLEVFETIPAKELVDLFDNRFYERVAIELPQFPPLASLALPAAAAERVSELLKGAGCEWAETASALSPSPVPVSKAATTEPAPLLRVNSPFFEKVIGDEKAQKFISQLSADTKLVVPGNTTNGEKPLMDPVWMSSRDQRDAAISNAPPKDFLKQLPGPRRVLEHRALAGKKSSDSPFADVRIWSKDKRGLIGCKMKIRSDAILEHLHKAIQSNMKAPKRTKRELYYANRAIDDQLQRINNDAGMLSLSLILTLTLSYSLSLSLFSFRK